MSYILDALRKAEQKRNLENIPELESAIVRGGPGRQPLPRGRLVLILLFLLALTALVVFRQPLLETGRSWISEIGRLTEKADSKPVVVKDEPAQPERQAEKDQVKKDQVKISQVKTKRQPDRPFARHSERAQSGTPREPPRETPAEKRVAEQAQQPAETAPQPGGDGPLPAALQQKLDAVNLTVISYSSDPVKRFIMAGADILREGDSLPGGILISRIRKREVLVEVEGREALLTP